MEELKLIALKALTDSLKSGNYTSFSDYYITKCSLSKPLRDWTNRIFGEACGMNNLLTRQDIYEFVHDQDIMCRTIPKHRFGLIRDDDYEVRVILDYDCNTTLAKYHVRHKPTGLRHRNSIDLGAEHLSEAPVTIIVS